MNSILLWIMVVGIFVMKSVWIHDEIRLFRNRLNFTMLKTNIIEFGILLLQIIQILYFPLPKTDLDGVLLVLGVLMYALGMIFAFWGKFSMKKVWGIPGEHKSKQQERLVTSGVFKYSRNPIYVGIVMIFLGFSVAFRSWLVVLRIPLFIYLYRSSLIEEKLLMKKFGEEYKKYKKKTPRFLAFI